MKIDAESLFIKVHDELEQRSRPLDLYENLSCSRCLRQLLLDERPLMDRANQYRKIKIRFLVTKALEDPPGLPQPVFRIALDQVDPQTSLIKSETISLKRDHFLKHKVMAVNAIEVSVHDMIDFAAHRAGAVHFHNEKIDHMNNQISDTTLIYQLRSICRVTLRALKPLRRVCKSQF